MKVLLIGATGLLGKPVIENLKNAGHELRLFSRTIDNSPLANHYETFQGDVFNPSDLTGALLGCEAVHISISKTDEALAVEAVVNEAKKQNIKLISYVSGATVCEENRWYELIDDKLRAEQLIKDSGIPYLIFRPTWFFESLKLMIRNNKASVIGKKLPSYHWVAADDFGKTVAASYMEHAKNKTIYIYGPQEYHMKDLLEKYCAKNFPEIKKVSVMPVGLLKFIGTISGNKEIKMVAGMFSYFEKVKEPDFTKEETPVPFIADTNFEKWLSVQ